MPLRAALHAPAKDPRGRSGGAVVLPAEKERHRHALAPAAHGLPHMSIQPRLEVGPADDPLEREAERAADAVVSGRDVSLGQAGPAPSLQRACACGGKCEDCKRKATLQRSAAGPGPTTAPPDVHEALSAPGRPLDAATRAFMEPRFGHSFAHVRVHDDARAARSAQAVGAHAYAVGHDVVFAQGRHAPGTAEGRRLLAHELAHVVQQGRSGAARLACYRPKGSPNYGLRDDGGLVEKPYEKGDVWINQIKIRYDSIHHHTDGDLFPTGVLTATYDGGKGPELGASIAGGWASEGLTDKGSSFTAKRIEGYGYNSTLVPKADSLKGNQKYFAPAKADAADMSWAIFFQGGQAIHKGALDWGSHACVHLPADSIMQRLNYHSRKGHTKVSVEYEEKTRKEACCARAAYKGAMPGNPCSGLSMKKDCP